SVGDSTFQRLTNVAGVPATNHAQEKPTIAFPLRTALGCAVDATTSSAVLCRSMISRTWRNPSCWLVSDESPIKDDIGLMSSMIVGLEKCIILAREISDLTRSSLAWGPA